MQRPLKVLICLGGHLGLTATVCHVFIMPHGKSQLPDTALLLVVICLHLVGDKFSYFNLST